MSKRAIFIFAGVLVLALVLVILGVVSFDRVRDPVYKGKSLS